MMFRSDFDIGEMEVEIWMEDRPNTTPKAGAAPPPTEDEELDALDDESEEEPPSSAAQKEETTFTIVSLHLFRDMPDRLRIDVQRDARQGGGDAEDKEEKEADADSTPDQRQGQTEKASVRSSITTPDRTPQEVCKQYRIGSGIIYLLCLMNGWFSLDIAAERFWATVPFFPSSGLHSLSFLPDAVESFMEIDAVERPIQHIRRCLANVTTQLLATPAKLSQVWRFFLCGIWSWIAAVSESEVDQCVMAFSGGQKSSSFGTGRRCCVERFFFAVFFCTTLWSSLCRTEKEHRSFQ